MKLVASATDVEGEIVSLEKKLVMKKKCLKIQRYFLKTYYDEVHL